MQVSQQLQHRTFDGGEAAPEEELKGPRARTRRLMLETAIKLMQNGSTPSVSDVAEAAEVSRATAYRYFPSQAALVQAVVDEALGPILEWNSEQDDAGDRVADLLKSSLPRIDDFEATFRAALRLSLEQWAQRQSGTLGEEPEFRRGHRVALLEQALRPIKNEMSAAEFQRLVKGLSLVFGIEGVVALKDICGLDADQTQDVALWAAEAMVKHATSTTRVAEFSKRGAR